MMLFTGEQLWQKTVGSSGRFRGMRQADSCQIENRKMELGGVPGNRSVPPLPGIDLLSGKAKDLPLTTAERAAQLKRQELRAKRLGLRAQT